MVQARCQKMRRATLFIGACALVAFPLITTVLNTHRFDITGDATTAGVHYNDDLSSVLVHKTHTPQVIFKTGAELDHFNSSKKNIVIYTAYRSGSSFTGELFYRNPDIHYLFEPFKLLSLEPNNYARNEFLQSRMAEYTMRAFNCDYSKIINDSKTLFPESVGLRKQWMKRIFEQSYERYTDLLKSLRHKDICRLYDIHVLKIIRGNNIKTMIPLMITFHVNVLYLIRDPRAVAVSRVEIDAVKNKTNLFDYIENNKHVQDRLVKEVRSECTRLTSLISFIRTSVFAEYSSIVDEFFGVVRYEDIAFEPLSMSRQIYAFMKLDYPDEVAKWVMESTTAPSNSSSLANSFGTTRDSKSTAEKWRVKLKYSYALKMQQSCLEPLQYFGYKLVEDRQDYENLKHSFVLEPSREMRYRIAV